MSQCETLDCREPATVRVESVDLDEYFAFCSSCASEKTEQYDDLERVEEL